MLSRFIIPMVFLILPTMAWAGKVALVIGNSQYESVAELDNPHNDASSVSRALAEQGFDVITAKDLGRVAMRDTLREFREMADRSDVAVVFYAGHGIEIAGTNYLVPVDARLEDERDAELEMVELDLVLGQISGAKSLKMVVLDACRNNPFVVKMQRSGGTRSVSAGLGRIDYAQADTLVAYAAAAGEITPDGLAGGNSPFTHAFLRAMQGPPTDVRRLMGRVRDMMRETVPGAAPFVYTSLGGGEFVINPNSSRTVVQPLPAGKSISEDFVRIDRDGTFEDWNQFLIRHAGQSDHPLYAFALEKREALRKQTDTRVATVQPDKALVEPEDKDQRTLIAATPAMSDHEAAKKLQRLLREAGCYRGAIDGILGRGSQRGLTRFEGEIGIAFPLGVTKGGEPMRKAIEMIEKFPAAKCPAPVVTAKPVAKPRVSSPQPKPSAAPAARKTETQNQTVIPEGSREPRRTKLLPEKGSEQIECTGPRAKFYQCD